MPPTELRRVGVTGPGWEACTTATVAYCQVGQHFIGANEQAFRYWVTPLLSIATCCANCAKVATEGEGNE